MGNIFEEQLQLGHQPDEGELRSAREVKDRKITELTDLADGMAERASWIMPLSFGGALLTARLAGLARIDAAARRPPTTDPDALKAERRAARHDERLFEFLMSCAEATRDDEGFDGLHFENWIALDISERFGRLAR